VKIHSQIKIHKMKKLSVCIMTAFLLVTIIPVQLKAGSEIRSVAMATNKNAESQEAHVLLTRLNEIYVMDKSNLDSSQKKKLRNEVLSIRKHFDSPGGGVYISVGAAIIIVLLLIILL
jgi:predicted Mrr-cat superfamily restriction endonuclease